MKLLQVIEKMDTGGAQRLLADLLRAFAASDQKPEITLALYQSLPESVFEREARAIPGLKVIVLGVDKMDHLKAIRRLRPLIARADVCHVHLFPALYHCAIASIGTKTRMVYTEHSSYNRRRNRGWLRLAERFVYSRYDTLACISNAVKINLATWLSLPQQSPKLAVVNNGVDLARFRAGTSPKSRRELFGRDGRPVLMVSRFVESKDHATLIRAIAEIDNKDIFAAFIGDGPTRPAMAELARELGVEDRIVFLGEREDIEVYISAAEIGVQSSNWEGFGLTVVEMMAGGLPVIVSDVSGMADLVKNVGQTFPRGNHNDLAIKIVELIERCTRRPGYRETLKTAESLRAETYAITTTAQRYLAIYSPQK